MLYVLRRYGLAVAVAVGVLDVLVAYLVGERLLAWEVRQIREWSR